MPLWSLRVLRRWTGLCALWLVAGSARGEGPAPAAGLHPLVIAAEVLYRQHLPESCEVLIQMASAPPGITDADLVRLQFVAAMRAIDAGDEMTARQALAQALQMDRTAAAPAFASPRLRELLEQARSLLPPATGNARPSPAGGEREPVPVALLKAVDALYTKLELDGAGVVLDLVRSAGPLSAEYRAQVSVRQGILRMEAFDEPGARAAFRDALEASPRISLPRYAPPKAVRVFQEVRATLPAAPALVPATSAAAHSPPGAFVASGAWLPAAAGVVAGVASGICFGLALGKHADLEAGRPPSYLAAEQARREGETLAVAGTGLAVGAGAALLGAGAMFLFSSSGSSVAVTPAPSGVTMEVAFP